MSDSASEAISLATRELVDANHILFDQGVVDGFGHVSMRHPVRPDHFLLARSMAPALVTETDVLEFDTDGAPTEAGGPAVYLERFIHSEIYRARPDVVSVVHSHSPAVVPFSVVSGTKLRPICHMCGFLGAATPVFEIRDVAGPGSDLLIRDSPPWRGFGAKPRSERRRIDARPWLDRGRRDLAPSRVPRRVHRSGRAAAVRSDEARTCHVPDGGRGPGNRKDQRRANRSHMAALVEGRPEPVNGYLRMEGAHIVIARREALAMREA